MKLFDVYPLNDIRLVKAEGVRLWDDKGNQYLDMYGGHAVISIGHTHPHWVKRIKEQLDQIAFYSNSVIIPIQQQLAEKLASISGKKDYQLFMVNSGAEANENALKLASFHTGRSRIVSFTKAFHGRTSLAVAATDNPAIVAGVNKTDHIVFLPYNDVNALESYFKDHGSSIAAIILEGIQGVGGIAEASSDFLIAARKVCDDYGAIFIADEVQCGYGRTGKFFSVDHAGINADIYTMAKGMGNGFPVGGILIAPHIKPKYGMLGTTFGGNHLACAAALAVLEVIEEEELLHKAEETGSYLKNALSTIAGVENLRGKGLMIGFDVPGHSIKLRKKLLDEYRILAGEAKPDVVRLLPALNIRKEEIDEFIHALKQSMVTVTAKDERQAANETVHIGT